MTVLLLFKLSPATPAGLGYNLNWTARNNMSKLGSIRSLNLITFHSFVISLMKCVSSGLRKHSYGQYPFIVIYSQLLLLGILNSRKITSLNQYYLSNLVFKSLQHHKHLFLILLTEITTKLPFPNFL